MGLLLDTHIWLWGLLDPDRLSASLKRALTSGENELHLSPISVWESLLLAERGRVSLRPDAHRWLRKSLSVLPVVEAPVTTEVALASRTITLTHRDPADRFIAATAAVFELTLATADARLLQCPDIEVLPNH